MREKRPAKQKANHFHHLWPLVLLWVLLLAAYSNSFQAGLIFDNAQVILEDSRVHAVTAENVQRILTQQYWDRSSTSGLYRPLTTASYLFNYAILGNGADPEGYHWVNLALHAANATLVYVLGLALLGEAVPALALAALWSLHPTLTDAVTNVVGRADLLATFSILAGLFCYRKSLSAVRSPARPTDSSGNKNSGQDAKGSRHRLRH